ncbi:MAG: radical SAM protein [Proteobacteria bacterium]|nr:radical SAM protein [Pseudomonadota bacterium]
MAPEISPVIPSDERLRVTEIYTSVQGESTHAGRPTVFVRLTGCNLRCTWCDSEFTFTGGTHRSIDDVVAEVLASPVNLVEVTGGEPLAQRQCIPLMQRLVDAGREVMLETSGSISIAEVPEQVAVVLDLKPPDSGEVDANLVSNIPLLKPVDEVKFVIASRRDFDWSVEQVRTHRLDERVHAVLFSPVWGQCDGAELVDWMLEEQVPARLSIQVHKVLWNPDERGV